MVQSIERPEMGNLWFVFLNLESFGSHNITDLADGYKKKRNKVLLRFGYSFNDTYKFRAWETPG